MNVGYAKTVAGGVITYSRPDQDYTNVSAMESRFSEAAIALGTTVSAYAIADYAVVVTYCVDDAETTAKLKIAQKQDVPEGLTIIPPEGVILANIPAEGYVVYIQP